MHATKEKEWKNSMKRVYTKEEKAPAVLYTKHSTRPNRVKDFSRTRETIETRFRASVPMPQTRQSKKRIEKKFNVSKQFIFVLRLNFFLPQFWIDLTLSFEADELAPEGRAHSRGWNFADVYLKKEAREKGIFLSFYLFCNYVNCRCKIRIVIRFILVFNGNFYFHIWLLMIL